MKGNNDEKPLQKEASNMISVTTENEKHLPIEDSPLPTDISDLRDVVDAINKLCDTMKTSYDGEAFEDCAEPLLNEEIVPEEIVAEVEPDRDWYVATQIEASPDEVIFKKVEHYNTETWRQSVSRLEATNSEELKAQTTERTEHTDTETWKQSISRLDVNNSEELKVETTERDEHTDLETCRQSVSRLEVTNSEEPKVESTERIAPTDPETWRESVSRSENTNSEDVPKVETTERVEYTDTETWRQSISRLEEVATKVETTERWSDSTVSLGLEMSDEPVQAPGEISEMYYTASSEVSLLSDLECPDKGSEEGERRECVVAGHVAAMRERFENMTRANTPCPDARDVTPSPDHLG